MSLKRRAQNYYESKSFEAESFITGEKNPFLSKYKKEKVCLKILFRRFSVF